jgi:membrane associated rhomboid family serine protease
LAEKHEGMVDRFRRTSIGLKLLSALLAFGFIVRMVVVLVSVNYNGASDIESFDSYIGFSTSGEPMTWIWTWLTYSFFQAEVSHFVWNYLLLILLIYWSKDRYVGFVAWKYWIVGALIGLLFLFMNEDNFSLIGSSAGITALWAGWLTEGISNSKKRDLTFWLGCIVFLLLAGIDIANYESGNLSLFAHVGGTLSGVVLCFFEKIEIGKMNWWSKIVLWFTPSPKLKVKRSNARFQTDDEFNAERKLKEDYLNSILDKISRSGFESLSTKEKLFLEKQKEN